ncbi:MAG: hypothetical protein FD130_1012 [Halothiobacillaceae bacterium]|nr:MAG: hypothetical protein FD130_1012 [Halothiobacillaceae bacterium]
MLIRDSFVAQWSCSLLLLCFVILMTSCGGGGSNGGEILPPNGKKLLSLQLSPQQTTLPAGTVVQVKATAIYSDSSDT